MLKVELVSQMTTLKFGLSDLLSESTAQSHEDLTKMGIELSSMSAKLASHQAEANNYHHKVTKTKEKLILKHFLTSLLFLVLIVLV